VLALEDDAPDESRLKQAENYYHPSAHSYEGLLAGLLEEPGETLRCLAAYHVGELGITSFRGRLEAIREQETGLFVSRVLERALQLLAGTGGPRLAHAR